MFCFVICLFTLLTGRTLGQEYHCSKFHYEEKLLEKMVRMEIRMEEMQKRLNELEQKPQDSDAHPKESVTSTIAFFATANAGKTYAAGDTLVFEIVETNLGDGYNSANGIFTTPKPGTYVFFSTVLGSNNVELWNDIVVNKRVVARFNSRGTEGRHDSGTASIIVQLIKGDKIQVKNTNPPGNTYGSSYTHFGGFRLSD